MSGPLALGGVTLEQHAGVAAALSEGFALAQILATEQLDAAGWRGADVAWKQRLAQDGAAGGSTFTAYRVKLEEAEDALSRSVTPLDDDLEAWLGFLHTWSSNPDPVGMLKKLGLGTNDVSRLRRRWSKRLDDNSKLALEAAKIAARGPKPLPAISVAPSKLLPFPWSKRAGAARPSVQPSGGAGVAPVDFLLDRYARLSAELAALPKGRAQVLERHELNEQSLADVNQRWQSQLAKGGELAADYRRLVSHHRARLDAARHAAFPQSPPEPPSSAPPTPASSASIDPPALAINGSIDETAMILALTDDVLPFERAPNKPPPASANLGPSPDAGETSTEIPALTDAFPFAGPARAIARPTQDVLDETSFVPALSFDDALPFAEGSGAPPVSSGRDPNERDLSGETGILSADLLGDLAEALPFRSADAPSTSETFASLTLEQLAAVAVELSLTPDQRALTLGRYHLTEETARAAFHAVSLQRERDPAVCAQWDRAYSAYYAYRMPPKR